LRDGLFKGWNIKFSFNLESYLGEILIQFFICIFLNNYLIWFKKISDLKIYMTKRKTHRGINQKSPVTNKMKKDVWDNFFPRERYGKCVVCESCSIENIEFYCVHIISNKSGGGTTANNLVPACIRCVSSINSQNLLEYKNKLYPYSKLFIKDIEQLLEQNYNSSFDYIPNETFNQIFSGGDSSNDNSSNDSSNDNSSNDSSNDNSSNDSSNETSSNDSSNETPSNETSSNDPSNETSSNDSSNETSSNDSSNDSSNETSSNEISSHTLRTCALRIISDEKTNHADNDQYTRVIQEVPYDIFCNSGENKEGLDNELDYFQIVEHPKASLKNEQCMIL
jgi:hypothetical protein